MSPYAPVPQQSIAQRPVVSGVEDGPTGRQFTVTFTPGQLLPPHRNASRVVITAVAGDGEITVEGLGTRALPMGTFVQLEAKVEHAIVAGDQGLELLVQLVANCCGQC